MAESITEVGKKSQENFVKDERVYIMGPFDRSISSCVIPDFISLIDCVRCAKDPAIEIFINSYGGHVAELYALMSAVEIAKAEGIRIDTYNLGVAGSCGSMLAVIGDCRKMSKYAVNYPHLGMTSTVVETFEQAEREKKRVNDWMNRTVSIYADHTKMSKNQLMKMLSDDGWNLTAEECLKLGFCDEII